MFGLPNLLTLIRLILPPLTLPVLLYYYLPIKAQNLSLDGGFLLHLGASAYFLALAATDYLDGYLARKYNLGSQFGRLFDPIADKVLVISALIPLLALHKFGFGWVLVLLYRELFVMSLRLFTSGQGLEIHVSKWGKLKTVWQYIWLATVIARPGMFWDMFSYGWIGRYIELVSLALAMSLAIFSAGQYGWSAAKFLMNKQPGK